MAKRDGFGGALMAATDEPSAPDDRTTVVFWLNKPFPLRRTPSATRRRLRADMQAPVHGALPSIPVVQIIQLTAYRRNISGVLDPFATFWNARQA